MRASPATANAVMAQAGPFAAIVFHNLVEVDQFGSIVPLEGPFPFTAELEAYRKVYQTYEPADARYLSNHRGHLMFVRPEEKHLSAMLSARSPLLARRPNWSIERTE